MALHLLDRIKGFEIRHRPGERLKLRIGIHTGMMSTLTFSLLFCAFCIKVDNIFYAALFVISTLSVFILQSSIIVLTTVVAENN